MYDIKTSNYQSHPQERFCDIVARVNQGLCTPNEQVALSYFNQTIYSDFMKMRSWHSIMRLDNPNVPFELNVRVPIAILSETKHIFNSLGCIQTNEQVFIDMRTGMPCEAYLTYVA